MKEIAYLPGAVGAPSGVVAYRAHATEGADGEAAPILGVEIPARYRDG